MDYETEEQQVEALKAWWAENGRAVIAGVVLGGGAIGGWGLWNTWQENKALSASDAYTQTIDAVTGDDPAEVQTLATRLSDDQPDSLYAAYARLAAARAAVEAGDLPAAATHLAWAMENAPQEDVRLIASVRLARVRGAEGDAAAGLSLLPSNYPAAFQGIVEEARGDLHALAGDDAAARTAYELARQSDAVTDPSVLDMKLNDVTTVSDS